MSRTEYLITTVLDWYLNLTKQCHRQALKLFLSFLRATLYIEKIVHLFQASFSRRRWRWPAPCHSVRRPWQNRFDVRSVPRGRCPTDQAGTTGACWRERWIWNSWSFSDAGRAPRRRPSRRTSWRTAEPSRQTMTNNNADLSRWQARSNETD